MCGAAPALLVLLARWLIPETPRFLLSRGRDAEASRAAAWISNRSSLPQFDGGGATRELRGQAAPSMLSQVKALFSRTYRARTGFVWGIWFTFIFSYYGLLFWLPTLSTKYKGVPRSQVYAFMMGFTLVGVLGRLSVSLLIDRFGAQGGDRDRRLWLRDPATYFWDAERSGGIGGRRLRLRLFPGHCPVRVYTVRPGGLSYEHTRDRRRLGRRCRADFRRFGSHCHWRAIRSRRDNRFRHVGPQLRIGRIDSCVLRAGTKGGATWTNWRWKRPSAGDRQIASGQAGLRCCDVKSKSARIDPRERIVPRFREPFTAACRKV